MTDINNDMLEALQARQPNKDLADKLKLYGQFVGSWRADIDFFPLGGQKINAEGEWHFGWVLDGKAIQDVWIFPARRLRTDATAAWHMYGSTVRWYDPAIDAWHITWFDPSRALELRQIGRAAGPDIVQVGEQPSGVWTRWRFVDIARDSFRWLGEMSWDKGASWTLAMEMRTTRV